MLGGLGEGGGKALFVVICINWATNRNWQTKLLHRKKVTQLNLLHQESVN